MVVCLVLAAMVTCFHGLVLVGKAMRQQRLKPAAVEAAALASPQEGPDRRAGPTKSIQSPADKGELPIASAAQRGIPPSLAIWSLFFMLNIVGALMIGACIYRFYALLEKEKATKVKALIEEARQRSSSATKLAIEDWERILEFSKRIRTLPLGGTGIASVILLVVTHGVNLATGIVSVVSALAK
jgi:hypothetical protein